MASIPDEILATIFSGLPVKSLLRFRCLSRRMCSLVDDTEFAKSHLRQSVRNESDLCLALDDLKPAGIVHFMDLDLDDNYLLELHRELAIDDEIREVKFLGTCNGLIALSEGFVNGDLQGMILRNPSTNKQQSVGNFWGDGFLDPFHEDVILNGFGYDADNDDYKLVRVRLCQMEETAKAVVYSFRAGGSRTLPDCDYVYAPIAGNSPGIYVAGNLHWIGSSGNVDPPSDSDAGEDLEEEDEDLEEMIIGLNLTTETFHVVPSPAPQNFFATLGALRGCLAVSSSNPETLDLEIWVMKEYSVATSWTRLVCIPLAEQEIFGIPGPISRVLHLTPKGDRVLVEINCTYLYWYNIANSRIEYFEAFANVPSPNFFAQLMSRSLISLPGFQN